MIDLTYLSERERTRDIYSIRYIVVHRSHLAENGEATAEWFKTHDEGGTGRKIPYHIYIKKDGTVEQLVPLSKIAPGAGILNKTGIQIALCGDLRRYPPTVQQALALKRVVSELTCWLGYNQVVGHTEVKGTSSDPKKVCPGKHLNMDGVRLNASEGFHPWAPGLKNEKLIEKGWVI